LLLANDCSDDTSLLQLGGCQRYRPDRIYIGINTVEIDECGEHQHKYNTGNYSCDEKRISDIYDEKGICGKQLIVTRFNPDNYTPTDSTGKKSLTERLKALVNLKKHLRTHPPDDKIHIYYLFYDRDNPRISQNIPHTLIQ